MLCLLLAILEYPLGFSLTVIVYGLILYVEVKIFSQKLGSVSSHGDFDLCDLFSGNATSFNSLSSHSCCSVTFSLSSSLLIYSASSLCSFLLLQIFCQNFSTSFIEGGFLIPMGCFPASISLKKFILPVESCPFFKSSKFLFLDLHFLFYFFFWRCYIIFIL